MLWLGPEKKKKRKEGGLRVRITQQTSCSLKKHRNRPDLRLTLATRVEGREGDRNRALKQEAWRLGYKNNCVSLSQSEREKSNYGHDLCQTV